MSPQLQQLIELALANNRDLRVAALNMEKSRARFRIRRADLLPTLAVAGSAATERLPADISATGQTMIARNDNLGLGLSSFEVDLFGRVGSLKDQALKQYLASEQARRSVQISLVAEVANNYLTLAADRERLQLAQDTLKSQQTSYRLVERRFCCRRLLRTRPAPGPDQRRCGAGGCSPLHQPGGPG